MYELRDKNDVVLLYTTDRYVYEKALQKYIESLKSESEKLQTVENNFNEKNENE